MILKLALFVAVIGVATLFDAYFDKNSTEFDKLETKSESNSSNYSPAYLVIQSNSFGEKAFAQKTLGRKLFSHSHTKFLQKYHQLRNFQVLKAEIQTQTTPIISSYHYLVFKQYFFTLPDDKPLG